MNCTSLYVVQKNTLNQNICLGQFDILLANCDSIAFWNILLVPELFFYYIRYIGKSDQEDIDETTVIDNGKYGDKKKQGFKPDPRVITLEKICEVAAKQKMDLIKRERKNK